MKQSAKNGCLLCARFLSLIEIEQLEEPLAIGRVRIYRPTRRSSWETDDWEPSKFEPDEEAGSFKLRLDGIYNPNLDIFLDPQIGRETLNLIEVESNGIKRLRESRW